MVALKAPHSTLHPTQQKIGIDQHNKFKGLIFILILLMFLLNIFNFMSTLKKNHTP